MKNNIDYKAILGVVLERCQEQSRYYREIAYNSDYKDQTIERIVNLGIAYNDVAQYIDLVVDGLLDKQSAVAPATRLGDPAIAGQAIADGNQHQTETEKQKLENCATKGCTNDQQI